MGPERRPLRSRWEPDAGPQVQHDACGEGAAVIARTAMSCGSVRQRERDHPRFDRATGHAR